MGLSDGIGVSAPLSRAVRLSLLTALLLTALAPAPAMRAAQNSPAASVRGHAPARQPKGVSVAMAPAVTAAPRSDAANRLIAWIAAARDNGALPFAVIDKSTASLYLFAADGAFLGETPVLLGVGLGDDSSPGIGAKNLNDIGPAERTTPAGRFVAKFGRAIGGQRVLWINYADAVALHAVTTTNRNEHRVDRLQSPTVDDNRISFGCINVGTRFYANRIKPLFRKQGGVIYIMPEIKSLDEVFPRVRLLPYLDTAAAR
jgi:hypothetical protein